MTIDPRPKLRGLAIKNDLYVIADLYGADVEADVVASLSPRYRDAIARGILPSSFYDEAMQGEILGAILHRYGRDALGRIGVAAAHRTVRRWHRFLGRIVGPERLLERLPGMWSYWRDTGRVHIERQTHDAVDILVEDNAAFGAPGNAEGYAVAAAFIVSVAGGRNVRIAVDRLAHATVRGKVRWDDARHDDQSDWFAIDAILAGMPARYR